MVYFFISSVRLYFLVRDSKFNCSMHFKLCIVFIYDLAEFYNNCFGFTLECFFTRPTYDIYNLVSVYPILAWLIWAWRLPLFSPEGSHNFRFLLKVTFPLDIFPVAHQPTLYTVHTICLANQSSFSA